MKEGFAEKYKEGDDWVEDTEDEVNYKEYVKKYEQLELFDEDLVAPI